MSALLVALAPFVLNGVMAILKKVGASNMSTPGKRFILAVLALIGVVAGNFLAGTPIQVDSITSLTSVAFEALGAFLAAHGSYHLFFKKK